jgi:hypothetical protein
MSNSNGVDPVPPSAYPSFQPVTTPPPSMPPLWTAVALLHPFSPPLSSDPKPNNPFFQLCVANLAYMEGVFFSAQVAGCSYGNWWYLVTPDGTQLSEDGGTTWTSVNMGWTLPSNWFGAQAANALCAGSSPLNWMSTQPVDWWKVPVPLPPPSKHLSAATWMWFDSSTSAPVRMMFGYGPPSPTMGDPTQLAFFQMYSFTYFPSFNVVSSLAKPTQVMTSSFPGFQVGNPNGYENFVWNGNFGMTAFMTPVNEAFNPLPTRVLYVWKPDSEYSVYSDRAQNTLMLYTYNPNTPTQPIVSQEALLTGPAPAGIQPPPDSDTGFLITNNADGSQACIGGSNFPFPQEPPDWVSIPGVEGTIQATINMNPVVAPNTVITIYSVLFPPAAPNYPEATYLWTWYAPQNSSGTESRPVTFMQSQSGVGVGTSLALADYFYYQDVPEPIDPANFNIPSACSQQTRKIRLRRRLP